MESLGPLVYIGAEAIARAVGIDPRQIELCVRKYELPAWKHNARGKWTALPEDLELWVNKMRKRYLKTEHIKE